MNTPKEDAPRMEPIRLPVCPTQTKFKCNPNWNYRGSNTKYKEKK